MKILQFPSARLRIVAKKIINITDEVKENLNSMLDIMYQQKGIGLAATQVNIHQRMIVLDVSEKQNQAQKLINPVIVEKFDIQEEEEGCLSVPEFRAKIPRAKKIIFSYVDEENNSFQKEAEGLLAICIQHEIDHLNGKLFIDYLSQAKRQQIRTMLKKKRKK
jgi:peptide deformylase